MSASNFYNPYAAQQPIYGQQYQYNAPMYNQAQISSPQYMQIQPNTMVGRIVNDVADIRPNETPTTGQPAVFPKADGSTIYLTCMDQTGRIITREYVPKEMPAEQTSANDEVIKSMQEQLNRIEKLLSPSPKQTKKGD